MRAARMPLPASCHGSADSATCCSLAGSVRAKPTAARLLLVEPLPLAAAVAAFAFARLDSVAVGAFNATRRTAAVSASSKAAGADWVATAERDGIAGGADRICDCAAVASRRKASAETTERDMKCLLIHGGRAVRERAWCRQQDKDRVSTMPTAIRSQGPRHYLMAAPTAKSLM